MHVRFSDVTIVGLGKSGLSAALFLLEKGCRVSVTDAARDPQVLERAAFLQEHGACIEVGCHTRAWIQNRTLVVASPGVAAEQDPIRWARELSIPVIGELELAAHFFPGRIIAVSGTNGKSTVTTLIGQALEAAGHPVFVGGNIGTPFTEGVDGADESTVAVIEVSSFQLETIEYFKPRVAVLLNITPDHLDRYQDFESYRRTKLRIFENQNQSDWAVVEEQLLPLPHSVQSRLVSFSDTLFHSHNANEAAVRCVANILKVPDPVISGVLKKFQGLEHRLEFAGEHQGVRYINDSKSTNIASTLWALRCIEGSGVWILGGRDKGADFKMLKEPLARKARGVVVMGEAGERIHSALDGSLNVICAKKLEDAFCHARNMARAGDTVVLSPACSSFDEFTGFEERGRIFKDLVLRAAS